MAFLAILVSGCTPTPIPTAVPVAPYMKMNSPADSDKPFPVPTCDGSCWLHTASNLLAGAGYGAGTTVQDRADDIWNDMATQYRLSNGCFDGGWIATALQWWLGSANNTWTTNPYTVVTVSGNTTRIPWANANGARDIGNELRTCNLVGLSISWPDASVAGGSGGHAITGWGDNNTGVTALTANPGVVRVTDSDNETGGNVQAYTYDAYTNPNPGGANEGNGWYFNYGSNHPFIKHIVTLSPTSGPSGPSSVRVTGSYKIHQTKEQSASDLHYRVGTDVDILTYRTWLDWPGVPAITEAQPRRELTVDWNLSEKNVPQCTWVTISTEFVEPFWNAIRYNDVHFTYPDGADIKFPDLAWKIETPRIDKAEAITNVTGGYVLGSFDVYNPDTPNEPAVQYRLVHQYLYNQSPEFHTFTLTGTSGFIVTNVRFGHSYGYPTMEELWRFENWMNKGGEVHKLGGNEIKLTIDWRGRLPYPEGDRGRGG
jgi:hypothetical protein